MKTSTPDPEFEALLAYLKQTRGFDFTAYKRSTLMRRVQKRMQTVGVDSYPAYVDLLEVRPDEFTQLFNTILINVTSFFRDDVAWDFLAGDIVPRILESKRSAEPIRVWSAGCASGEEAYTVVMLLAEQMGAAAFRDRVKVYGTDVDEDALSHARQACYTAHEVEGVAKELLDKHFEQSNGKYCFDKELRRSVIFGRHDLIQDAPISRVDLLLCRNALMYFNAEAQERILARFYFALNDAGFLFLGTAETLLSHSSMFVPMDLKMRVFQRSARTTMHDRVRMLSQAGGELAVGPLANHVRLRESAFDAGGVAQIVVDASGALALANDKARRLFGLGGRDTGRPLQDLEISYRPVELRSLIDEAMRERRPSILKDVQWTSPGGQGCVLEINVTPLSDVTGALIGSCITFNDITRFRALQDELQHYNQELETAYEELQSTNEELQTTNEELQSTVEELETTNEELQSTNEELETMNEELQSTNEELETMNEELASRTEEAQAAKMFLESVLGSLRDGVVVVDKDFNVLAWNERAHDLWGLRAEEVVGKHLLNLDIGLPVDQLRQPVRACLAGDNGASSATIRAVNRRGKAIQCRIACSVLAGKGDENRGVIVTMEELPGK